MTNSYRLDFNPAKVIAALDRKNPILWNKLSAKTRAQVDIIGILKTIRSHELSIKSDLQDAENAIASGNNDWKDYLNCGESCSLQGHYQGYVTFTYLNSWM